MLGHVIVKFDVVEEVPVRGPDGFCVECEDDEPGELLFPIKKEDPSTHFLGFGPCGGLAFSYLKSLHTHIFEEAFA